MSQNIDQHIENNRDELSGFTANGQRRRFLEGELDSLLKYKESHPDKIEDPSPLELFCNENPEAPECRIYEC
jgi:hypothetical protein